MLVDTVRWVGRHSAPRSILPALVRGTMTTIFAHSLFGDLFLQPWNMQGRRKEDRMMKQRLQSFLSGTRNVTQGEEFALTGETTVPIPNSNR